MNDDRQVKPYFKRIKHWKVRNIVMGYLAAGDKFKHAVAGRNDTTAPAVSSWLSFEELKDISEILYELKEDQHLIYRRLIDPQKNVFEDSHKFAPDDITIAFMNNVGLIFHKVMVARELDYILEHYVEQSELFQENMVSLETLLKEIYVLFEEGIKILEDFILANTDNPLLLTMLLENNTMIRQHFGANTDSIVVSFASNKRLDEVYFKAAQYYADRGRPVDANEMLKVVLKKNADHQAARMLQFSLQP